MTSRSRLAAGAMVCLAAVASTTAPALAQNVIPGDVNPGTVATINPSTVSVSVTQLDLSTVRVDLTNRSAQNLTCAKGDTGGTIGGTVTEAEVVQMSLAYFAAYAYKPSPAPTFGSSGNIQTSPQTLNATIAMAPLFGFLPSGSIAPLLGDAYAARDAISGRNATAKQAGHVATFSALTLNANGGTASRTVVLPPPSTGPRTDATLGVFLLCEGPASNGVSPLLALSGYEGGFVPAATLDGLLPLGSVGAR